MIDRYFSAFGPATIQDFKHWSGLRNSDYIETLEKLLENYICYIGEDGKNYYSKAKNAGKCGDGVATSIREV